MTANKRRAAVFVSFASPDTGTARQVSEHLEDAGIGTFFAPRDITGGMNFALEIVRAIASCDAVLVLLSPAAIASPHVRREVSLAIDERRALLPVALPGTTYPRGFSTEWTYWFSAVQVMDYDSPEQTLHRLRSILPRDHAAGPAKPPPGQAKPVAATRRKLVGRSSSPSALLRPDSLVPAALGRESELARLEQWCLRDQDFDIRTVVGAAGQGKTRLARELMRLFDSRDWRTVLLPPSADGVETILELTPRPTLFVIDYAETRSDQIFKMFVALLEHGVHDKVRFLLLARTASDWWNTLIARDVDVAELVADVTVQPLKLLTADRETVNRLFTTACEQFAKEIGVPTVPVVSAPYKTYTSVLDVLEDALVVVLGAGQDTVTNTDRLLAHERRYIAASARAAGITDLDAVDLNRIAAALTLYGAASEDEAARIVEECYRDLSPVVRRQVARLFRRLYPGPRTYIDGLRPDALAEDLLAEVLEADGRLPASASGLNALGRTSGQQRRALITLARGAMRHSALARELEHAVGAGDFQLLLSGIEVATQVEEPDRLIAAIETAVASRPTAELIELLNAVPDESVALAELAARLARRAMVELPLASQQTLQGVVTAMDCSNRFSDAGWSIDAADSAAVAVERLRRLHSGDQNSQVLGRALSNLSNRLWELGKLTESLDPAIEAVECLDQAGAPVSERAAAHSNLAFRLSEVGRHREAMARIMEADHLCVELGVNDVSLVKTRGSVLNNLTCISLATGDIAEAKQYGIACVDLRRSQALQNRDRFLPYVARALANASPAAEVAGDRLLADRFLVEARSLHRLTGLRAPIFRFEEAESATLGSLILLGRSEFGASSSTADEASRVLSSLPMNLGELTSRLELTLLGIKTAAAARERVRLIDVIQGAHDSLQLPRLLEYRDL